MFRNFIAVIAGNLVWTVLWLGLNAVLKAQAVLPSDPATPVNRASALLVLLVGSVVLSVLAGFTTTALASGASYGPAIALTIVQLALGIFFQTAAWRLMPVWYHISFLALLAPATLAGAWLKLR